MRLSNAAVLAVALASTASADVVKIPVARSPAGSDSVAGVRKRNPRLTKRATVTESLVNNVTYGSYFASVSVGTPGQTQNLALDTGSSDAWVVSSDAPLCTEKRLQLVYDTNCGTTFDSSSSSSFTALAEEFQIQYVDGSGAEGTYFTDDLKIGSATVKSLQMGLANDTSIGTGILGIGFELNEASETIYSNLVASMINQTILSTMAYSLYLNDYQSSTGNILFGGVDTDKFIGTLAVVPILPDSQSNQYSSFTVGLTGISFAFPNGTTYNQSMTSESGSLDAVLDSGTTLTYLPNTIATELFDSVGAYQYTDTSGSVALVDCNLDATFTFRINETAVIAVPADELVIDAYAGYQDQLPSEVPFAETCLFGIQNMGDDEESDGAARVVDYALMGDTFLRSAYVVYDLDHLQIGLAQANLNSTSTNVQELSSSAATLSAYSGVASQTESSGTSGSGSSSGSSSSSSSGTSTSTTISATTAGTTTTNTATSESGASASAAGSGSGKSAAVGRGTPGYDGLMAVVGITAACAMSGSLLFWL